MDVPALDESADMPDPIEAVANSLAEILGDEDLTAAFAEAGLLTVALEENGDVTITAGSVSRTVPAAVAMGEAGEDLAEGEDA